MIEIITTPDRTASKHKAKPTSGLGDLGIFKIRGAMAHNKTASGINISTEFKGS